MKAARFHAREDVRVDDLPEPETREGTVKIKVDWCGICGTDLHEYLEGPIFTPAEAPHPLTGERNRSSSATSSPATSPRSAGA
jgi:(R,R)-butanediol dehydrogenase / meso-butanediol dehydrogenase / diacetyl reductase